MKKTCEEPNCGQVINQANVWRFFVSKSCYMDLCENCYRKSAHALLIKNRPACVQEVLRQKEAVVS